MFETSLLESGGTLKTKSGWWAIAAFQINAALLLTLVLIPFFHPAMLPKQALSILLVAPPPPPSAPTPLVREAAAATVAHFASQMIGTQLMLPTIIPTTIANINDGPVTTGSAIGVEGGMDEGGRGESAMKALFESRPAMPAVVAQAVAPKKPVPISAGVAQGRLISKAIPPYPAIARASRTEGTVVLAAVISKAGTIEKLHVVSGPMLLHQAALDAVGQWRYKPYLLNGDPVEVETEINVIFSLSN